MLTGSFCFKFALLIRFNNLFFHHFLNFIHWKNRREENIVNIFIIIWQSWNSFFSEKNIKTWTEDRMCFEIYRLILRNLTFIYLNFATYLWSISFRIFRNFFSWASLRIREWFNSNFDDFHHSVFTIINNHYSQFTLVNWKVYHLVKIISSRDFTVIWRN